MKTLRLIIASILLPVLALADFAPISSTAYEKSHVFKQTGGTATMIWGYNSGGAKFILTFNRTSVPANGAVPYIAPQPVAATSAWSIVVPPGGLPFTTGLVVCGSSTADTLTLDASAEVFFSAMVN